MWWWDIQGMGHPPASNGDLDRGAEWEASATACPSLPADGSPTSPSAATPAVAIVYLRCVALAAESRGWVSPFALAHPEGDSVSHPELSHLLQRPLPSSPAGREGAFAEAPASAPGDSAEWALTCLQPTYMSFLGYTRNLFALLPQGRCEKKRVCVCVRAHMCACNCSCGKSSISYSYTAEHFVASGSGGGCFSASDYNFRYYSALWHNQWRNAVANLCWII